MKGVDHFDQMIKYYKFSRKSNKWTKKITLYFFQMAIYNAFSLYKEYSKDKKKLDLLGFHEMLYLELISFDESKWPNSNISIPHAEDINIELDESSDDDDDDESSVRPNTSCEQSLFSNDLVNIKTPEAADDKEIIEDDIRLDASHLHDIKIAENRLRCEVCRKNNIRKEVKYRCATCNVPLCPIKCHAFYHKKIVYWKT